MRSGKILITGFNGFVGQHCAKEFRERGFETIGLTNSAVNDPMLRSSVDEVMTCDLSDPTDIGNLELKELAGILNLAGIATNAGGDAERIRQLNVDVHINLYRHIARLGLSPRIIAVSSGAVYDPDQTMPETEESKLKDASAARPYEASKILMEQVVRDEFGDNIVVARPFNHIGPGQVPGFIVPDLAQQIANAMDAGSKTLQTGNLTTLRDYTDVRDVARAYADLIEADKLQYNIYNICSGRVRSGEEILSLLIKGLGAPESYVPTEDPSKIREGDANLVVGSNKRIQDELGWSPTIPIEETIQDFCDWYLSIR